MGANYENVTIRPTITTDAAQRPARGWRVTFTTKPSGQVGELVIEGDEPDPDAVDQAVGALAGKLETIVGR